MSPRTHLFSTHPSSNNTPGSTRVCWTRVWVQLESTIAWCKPPPGSGEFVGTERLADFHEWALQAEVSQNIPALASAQPLVSWVQRPETPGPG